MMRLLKMNSNLLGLVYAAFVEGDKQALRELNDVFEENGLERIEGKYELWFCAYPVGEYIDINEFTIEQARFATQLQKNAFIAGMNAIFINSEDWNYVYGDSEEEVKGYIIENEELEI